MVFVRRGIGNIESLTEFCKNKPTKDWMIVFGGSNLTKGEMKELSKLPISFLFLRGKGELNLCAGPGENKQAGMYRPVKVINNHFRGTMIRRYGFKNIHFVNDYYICEVYGKRSLFFSEDLKEKDIEFVRTSLKAFVKKDFGYVFSFGEPGDENETAKMLKDVKEKISYSEWVTAPKGEEINKLETNQ